MDSILIDEARTPLIISGQAEKPSERYIKCAKLADALTRDLRVGMAQLALEDVQT